jgi:2,4-dienoyl-CoA reductase-like NADH-dependent reductase (Old Yellow Enzyme family)/thioredoxin reductase
MSVPESHSPLPREGDEIIGWAQVGEHGSMPFYANLFSPIRIGRLRIKNRLLMSAMSINFGVDANGYVTDQLGAYFAARAKGGVGMMLMGGGCVHPSGLELPDLPRLWDDACIPALAGLAERVKSHDVLFGVQLMHGGRQAYHDEKVAPSAIMAPALVKSAPRALTLPEIREMVSAFGDAARRCQQAGFDFVEIHGAHGYLINQFLSPNANLRTDDYGGGFENRVRFFLEVLTDIKTKCGAGFPVGARFNGEDYIENGWTLEDACRLAPLLESAGADYLHVSAGVYGSRQLTIPSMYVPHGCFSHLAAAVKAIAKVPVVAVGRIKDPAMAEQLIRDNAADMVALGRSLLADPQWPNKAKAHDDRRIRPCIGCCLGCIHAVFQLEPGGCVVNPDVGREYLLREDDPHPSTKTVLVIGAGPGGLAAARMAALRGHRVSVYDSRRQPGGLLRLASIPPGRAELGDIIQFYLRELQRLHVPVTLYTEVDREIIDRLAPDDIVLASGSLPDMPIIKGLFKTDMTLCTVTEVLEGRTRPGDRVMVLGGGQAGLVLADFLAEAGCRVVVLNRKAHFAEEMSANDRFYLRERLKRDSVRLHKKVRIDTILPDGAIFTADGQSHTLSGYDMIVLAEARVAVREAMNLLKSCPARVHVIGDAKTPRHLMMAISEGEEIARVL